LKHQIAVTASASFSQLRDNVLSYQVTKGNNKAATKSKMANGAPYLGGMTKWGSKM